MNKHTPGPWMIDTALKSRNYIVADIGCGCGRLHTIAKARDVDGVYDGSGNENHCPTNEIPGAANARLMAAAPDMLEALKSIRDEIGPIKGWESYDMIERAIAKAEGTEE